VLKEGNLHLFLGEGSQICTWCLQSYFRASLVQYLSDSNLTHLYPEATKYDNVFYCYHILSYVKAPFKSLNLKLIRIAYESLDSSFKIV